jgi:hypothetical protein
LDIHDAAAVAAQFLGIFPGFKQLPWKLHEEKGNPASLPVVCGIEKKRRFRMCGGFISD